MMKNGVYFIVIVLLVAKLFKIDLCKLEDLWSHNVDTKINDVKKQNMEYMCKY